LVYNQGWGNQARWVESKLKAWDKSNKVKHTTKNGGVWKSKGKFVRPLASHISQLKGMTHKEFSLLKMKFERSKHVWVE
jgi:hypothetical protein